MILNDIFIKTAKRGLLFSAKISLTSECNLSCRHCYVEPPQREPLSTEAFKEVIRQLALSGCLFLTLTGGEPTMFPGFWEIVSFARQNKFFIRLFTNGTFLDDKAVEQLHRYGVNEVYVSLYGHNSEVHDLVTSSPGSFEKTVKAIVLLKKQKIKVCVKTSMMTLNRDYALEIENFCQKLGVSCNISYLLSPKTNSSTEPFLLQYPDGPGSEMFSRTPRKSFLVSAQNVAHSCSAAENSCYIECDGTLYPCVNYRYPCGNIMDTSLQELWCSTKMSEVRVGKTAPQECKSCSAINNCLRCPGLSYHESGGKNGHSRIQCYQTGLLDYIKGKEVYSI